MREGVGDELDAETSAGLRSEFSSSGDRQWLVKRVRGEEEARPCKSSVSLMMF